MATISDQLRQTITDHLRTAHEVSDVPAIMAEANALHRKLHNQMLRDTGSALHASANQKGA